MNSKVQSLSRRGLGCTPLCYLRPARRSKHLWNGLGATSEQPAAMRSSTAPKNCRSTGTTTQRNPLPQQAAQLTQLRETSSDVDAGRTISIRLANRTCTLSQPSYYRYPTLQQNLDWINGTIPPAV